MVFETGWFQDEIKKIPQNNLPEKQNDTRVLVKFMTATA
jgi:hypothetical protein